MIQMLAIENRVGAYRRWQNNTDASPLKIGLAQSNDTHACPLKIGLFYPSKIYLIFISLIIIAV
jgi:hypothetical protein